MQPTEEKEGEAMPRILMVDGDPDVVHAGRNLPEKHAMTVAEARGIKATLARCEEFSPDLLYIDVMHRRLKEGVSIAEHVRASGLRASILILATVDRSKGFFTYQDDGSLAPVEIPEKPMEPAALVKAIEHVLGT
jgi:CheY-like chemotaxis protein